MWQSKRQKKLAQKKELETLRREIQKEELEKLLPKTNLKYEKDKTLLVEIPFLSEKVAVEIPSLLFKKEGTRTMEMPSKIILLKYLKNLGALVSLCELSNLRKLTFFNEGVKRSVEKAFGNDLDLFIKCALSLGGQISKDPWHFVTFSVLPGVKLLMRLSEANEEKPANLEVYVPETLFGIFSPEEINYLAKYTLRKLLKEGKRLVSEDSF
ncbi:MAG: DUF3786 domain-containing protein [Desulfobacterota bacterium]|nr:DUF3786 domain-containing protein [Thermodesulfobacteriota bacterium]MDW8002128.1 DUF3786 domain-containing protein [Deltaproteobacteria bacterium]